MNDAQDFFVQLRENQEELESTNEELIALLEQLGHYEEQINYKDQLTGLFNRRYFEESLQRMDNADCLPLTICMIDINGLKLTNDAFGTLVGDQIL